jgi:septal ring factor EnvC (AmiA/AmiB activator)
MGLADNNKLLAEKDKAEEKAQKLCDEKDHRIDFLEKENRELLDSIAKLRQRLGAAGVKDE